MKTRGETSWAIIILTSVLCVGVIIAIPVIVRLWSLAFSNADTEVFSVSDDSSVYSAQSADNEITDLDAIPEGNEDLGEPVDTTSITETTTEATITETTTTETTDKDPTDWLEFDSRALPIRFNYPADWKLWEGTSPLSDYVQIADYQSKPQDAFADTVPGHKLEIAIVLQPEDMALKKWIKTTDKEFTNRVGTYEDVLVDGFPGILDYQVLGYSTFASVYIPLGDGSGQVMLLSLYGPEEDFEQLRPLLQDILNSVRITKK